MWKITWIAFIGAVALLTPPPAAAAGGILSVRHWVAPDHTRVVFDVSRETAFKLERQGDRLFVDLAETAFPAHLPAEIQVGKPLLEAILLSPGGGRDGVRLTLCLPAAAQTKAFALNPYQDKPHRIVIDIVLPEVAKLQSEARGRVRMMRQDRIVVIDPGHGGESVGAVGRGGLLEKDVVLVIARQLRDLLNRQEGYRAFLTRDGDYYVSFEQRLAIAREYGADIFLSIHADGARNRKAEGASVYSLSLGGASSEAARILAQEENLADFLGGVPNGENSGASDPIILDMFQTHTINQSRTLGEVVLKHLERANRLKFPTVQEAPFRVLKLPQIPSVLIETAFITNTREEKLLKSSGFQKQIVAAVAASVQEFIPPLPVVAQLVEEEETENTLEKAAGAEKQVVAGVAVRVIRAASGTPVPKASPAERTVLAPPVVPPAPEAGPTHASYRVRMGDTLGKIAQREGTSIAVLLRLNRMKLNDPLLVGRLLQVPMKAEANKGSTAVVSAPDKQGMPAAPGGEVRSYRVRMGDTLGKIAQREGTSIAVLLRLNRMKLNDPLLVGRLLQVPVKAEANKGSTAVVSAPETKRKQVAAGGKVRHYRVKNGDSLTKVAARERTTVTILAELNSLKVTDHLIAGRMLLLPAVANHP